MIEFLTLLPVLGVALAWKNNYGLSAGTAILHAIASIVLVLFIAGLADLLYPATVLVMIIGSLLFLVGVIPYIRDPSSVPAPLVLLLLFSAVYWLVHRDSSFFYYDEYSHWGVYLRDLLSHHQYWGSESNAMHLRNLPGTALWHYFFAVFSNRPEGAAYLAQFVLLLTPLLVLWEKLSPKEPGWFVAISVLVVVAIYNFGHGFTSLYLDHVLGLWFAGVLLGFMYESARLGLTRLLCFLLPLASIVLFKSTGFFFVLACCGIIGLLSLSHRDLKDRSIALKLGRSAVLPVTAIIVGILIASIWSINRDNANLPADIASTGNLAGSLVTQDSVYSAEQQEEISRRFKEVFFSQQISKDELSAAYNAFSYPMMSLYTDSFRLTTASLLLLSAVFIALLSRFIISDEQRLRWGIAQGMTWLTAAAYIGVLYLGYRYIANDHKGFDLSSYIRYSHSMLLPLLLVCFAPLVPAFAEARSPVVQVAGNLKLRRSSIAFGIPLLLLLVFETPYVDRLYKSQMPPDLRLQTEPFTATLRARIGDAPLWVFFPNSMTNGFIEQLMQFQLSPGRAVVEEDINALLGDQQSMLEELERYDYAWFIIQSEEIDAALESLIGMTPESRVYRITKGPDGLGFEPVENAFGSP